MKHFLYLILLDYSPCLSISQSPLHFVQEVIFNGILQRIIYLHALLVHLHKSLDDVLRFLFGYFSLQLWQRGKEALTKHWIGFPFWEGAHLGRLEQKIRGLVFLIDVENIRWVWPLRGLVAIWVVRGVPGSGSSDSFDGLSKNSHLNNLINFFSSWFSDWAKHWNKPKIQWTSDYIPLLRRN